jgi:23S rRNA (cytidine1920-2'-O)/16S rRNA (cytidine1409-2'-O)-methyltransferase
MGTLASLVEPGGDIVVLVKPQFEVGRQRLGKNGIVRSAADRAWAITEVAQSAIDAGLKPRGVVPSPLLGSEGNAEFLLWLGTEAAVALPWEALVKSADDLSLKGGP